MEDNNQPETGGFVEVKEKPYKHPKYLPRHLGPSGAWKPIKIGNLGAAFRAGKGCISGKRDFTLKPLEKNSAESGDTEAEPWGSD